MPPPRARTARLAPKALRLLAAAIAGARVAPLSATLSAPDPHCDRAMGGLSGLRFLALRRAARGTAEYVRRAPGPFRPPGAAADAAEGPFFKNPVAGERIGATMLFQDKNDTVAPGVLSIFSWM